MWKLRKILPEKKKQIPVFLDCCIVDFIVLARHTMLVTTFSKKKKKKKWSNATFTVTFNIKLVYKNLIFCTVAV